MQVLDIRPISCAVAILLTVTAIVEAQPAKPSAIVCDNFARDYSQRSSACGQVLGRAVVGSLVGLGIGSIAGAGGLGPE